MWDLRGGTEQHNHRQRWQGEKQRGIGSGNVLRKIPNSPNLRTRSLGIESNITGFITNDMNLRRTLYELMGRESY